MSWLPRASWRTKEARISGRIGDVERRVLREVAHLLPARWEQLVDVLAAPVPPAPAVRVAAPDDEASGRLRRVEHIVVLTLENRSFDPTKGTSPRPLTDFQTGFYEMARLLRRAGLPGGHP